MKTKRIQLEFSDNLDKVMPYLTGQVFHVSKLTNLDKIKIDNEIKSNKHNKFISTFGSSDNSYFKNKNCISLFDFRNIETPKHKENIGKCSPISALTSNSGIVIFILKKKAYNNLITRETWKDSNDLSQMVVPYIEIGYLNTLPLSLIETIYEVIAHEDHEPNSLVAKLMKARQNISG